MSEPVVLEFVGLPGGGKSTIARHVVRELTSRGHRVLERPPVKGNIAAMRIKPNYVFGGIAALVESLWLSLLTIRPYYAGRLRRALVVPTWLLRWELIRQSRASLIILDEGVIQNVWAIVIGGRWPSEEVADRLLRRVLRNVPQRYNIVHCVVDTDTALNRIAERGDQRNRFDVASASDRGMLLERNRPVLDHLLCEAVRITGASVLTLDASKPPSDLVSEVMSFLADKAPIAPSDTPPSDAKRRFG
jgi:hypothetical protein